MKSGWQTKPLGELCEVLDHKRRPITKRDRVVGPYPYYGATGVLDHVAEYLFDEPLVLVGEDGAKWSPGENTAFAVEGKCWVNNHAHVLRPHRDAVLDGWLIQFFRHTDISEYVSGLTVPKLNQGMLRQIPIPIPPLAEQRRILEIIEGASSGIASAEATTESNRKNARALFESFLQRSLDAQGPGWVESTLGDVCSIARGGSPRPIRKFLTSDPNGINWIKISDATASGKYIYKTEERIIPDGVKRSRRVHDGDFLLSNSMSFGRPYIMRTTGCIHDGWLVLSDYASRLDQDFLYYVLGSQLVFQQFDRLAAGSTVRNLNIALASQVEIPVPPLDQQKELAAQFGVIAAATQRLTELYRQKQGALGRLQASLLDRAFAGQL